MPVSWIPVNKERFRLMEAVIAAARGVRHKSEALAKALTDMDAIRKRYCKRPKSCRATASGQLCRSCSMSRIVAAAETRKSRDWLTQEQRREVAGVVLLKPEKSYREIADDWLVDKSTVVSIAREFGVSRRKEPAP